MPSERVKIGRFSWVTIHYAFSSHNSDHMRVYLESPVTINGVTVTEASAEEYGYDIDSKSVVSELIGDVMAQAGMEPA